ncbi:MAG: HD domain-containing protein [Muribaculaceae bacterium]|nr:HD domain-containing protein [Muribaculaceae bacterium]
MEHYHRIIPDWQGIIDSVYPAERPVRKILLDHSRRVADLAMALSVRNNFENSPEQIEAAAMLHDIGIIRTNAPDIDCHGDLPYICHGIAGADILRNLGINEMYARVCERHIGVGFTQTEIKKLGLPIPLDRSMAPRTLIEKLVCYADCFFSKTGDGKMKTVDQVREEMAKYGDVQLQKFNLLVERFGAPDQA